MGIKTIKYGKGRIKGIRKDNEGKKSNLDI
jgi:hypothetical protein